MESSVRKDGSPLECGIDAFLRDAMALRAGERLLFYVEGLPGKRLAMSLVSRAESMGVVAELLDLDPASDIRETAERITKHCRDGRYSAVCELSGRSFYQTGAWHAVRESGARIISLGGLDEESFSRCVAAVNQAAVRRACLALRDRLRRARSVRITTPAGTGFTIDLGVASSDSVAARLPSFAKRIGRKLAELVNSPALAASLGPHPLAAVFEPGGVLSESVRWTFLGGQVALRGIPFAARGRVVVDGVLHPRVTPGPLTERVTLILGRGRVIGAEGGAEAAAIRSRFAKAAPVIEHVCIGMNPAARVEGCLLESERVLTGVTVGFGRGFDHTDCVLRLPRTELDGELLADNGRFVDPSLVASQDMLLSTP